MKTRLLIPFLSVFIINAASLGFAADVKSAKPAGFTFSENDWPNWRGPNRNGIAASNQKPPLEWSETKNVLWKSPIPGRGHGSVTVVGDRVMLATADKKAETQSVLCFDRKTGKRIWKTDVHRGGLEKKGNRKASQASSTLACDGERVFISFLNNRAVYTTALSLDGKQLWQTKITDYVVHQGYGSSPAVYGPLVIVSADNKGGGAIAGLNRKSGKIVWKKSRPKTPNYASPVILKVAGRDQLLFTGCNLVSSFHPLTGKKLWEFPGATTECVTTTVTDGTIILTSGGYPDNHVAAVRGDGSGKVVWEKKVRVYVPSMLIRDGHVYAVTDAGAAYCWNCKTGKQMWRNRLNGTFSASPVMVGNRIFATSERGKTFVFTATPKTFKLLATNDLGNESLATPTICGSRLYLRAAKRRKNQRQEMLYCVGEKQK